MNPNPQRVYLDHNATSVLRPEAVSAMDRLLRRPLGNPSSLHAEGREARAAIESARDEVAQLVGVSPGQVVFTSGGSESLTAAVRGVCDRAPRELRKIVVSTVEHSAVLEAARIASRRGFVVVQAPVGQEGRVHLEHFLSQLRPGVALAAMQWANNETGVIQPVEEVARACRQAGIPFLVDAVQAAGKVEINAGRLGVDLLALSGHKLGAPQGTGALVVREGIVLNPLIAGGAQEKRRRGGTPAVTSIVGLGAAARAARINLTEEAHRMLRLRAKIETRLRELYPEIRFHGQASPRLPNTVNFAIPDVPGETLAIALDLAGFAVSTGSACASGAIEPSHVIRAMGFAEEQARRAVRVSTGWSTTPDDVDRFLAAVPRIVEQVRKGLSRTA